MRTAGASNWPVEREDTLRRLWVDEGRTSGYIAEAMGLTRNAVIGKVVRMKLPKHDRPTAVSHGRRRRPDGMSFTRAPFKAKLLPESLPGDMRRLRGEAWKPLDGAGPVPLIALDKGMCKWPVTEDAPFLFCGHAAGEHSYCEIHQALAFGRGTPAERRADVLEAEVA